MLEYILRHHSMQTCTSATYYEMNYKTRTEQWNFPHILDLHPDPTVLHAGEKYSYPTCLKPSYLYVILMTGLIFSCTKATLPSTAQNYADAPLQLLLTKQ